MQTTIDLHLITTNVMEGTGFKIFLEQNRPDYNVSLMILPMNSSLGNLKLSKLKENSVIFIDTDSFENENLLSFLKQIMFTYKCKCILHSKLSTPGLLMKARELFVDGYIIKSSPISCILNCLDVIKLGGTYYDSRFYDLLKSVMIFEKDLSLTERKLLHEVLLFSNRTIKDLAGVLNISKHTVEVHLSNLYKKAHVNGYTELVSCFSL